LDLKTDILIIDGRNLLWRTSDAFSDLSTVVGGEEIGTGGIYGFLSILIRIFNRYGGRVIIAWEGKNNFRYKLYPEYKKRAEPDSDRQEMIADLREQERRLKAILRAMGVEQYFGTNCEADDVMGRLAAFYEQTKSQVVIYTGDSDLRQLVCKRIAVVAPGFKGQETVYNAEQVKVKHGVAPKRLADLKALSGDSSDNIPGVRGIGQKTAEVLIGKYKGVEGVIKGAKKDTDGWPVAERFRSSILEAIEDIRLYKKLTKIDLNAGMKAIAPKRSQRLLVRHLKAYRFASLIAPLELGTLMKMSG